MSSSRNNNLEERDLDRYRPRLKQYMEERLTPSPKAGRSMYVCPLPNCGSGTGSHGTGALSVTPDGLHWKCFSCGEGGSIYDLVIAIEGDVTNVVEAYEFLERRYGAGTRGDAFLDAFRRVATPAPVRGEDDKKLIAEHVKQISYAGDNRAADNYFRSRGFTTSTIRKYGLGYDNALGRFIVPYPPESPDRAPSYYVAGSLTGQKPKYMKPKGRTEPLFNEVALDGSLPVFIVEGQLDALSIIQEMEGEASAISTGGMAYERVLQAARGRIERGKTVPPIIILYDADERGQAAADAFWMAAKEVKGLKTIVGGLTVDDAKDANDALRLNPRQFREDLVGMCADAMRYNDEEDTGAAAQLMELQQYNIANLVDAMERRVSSQPDGYIIKTPFGNLNEALDGGFEPSLVVLGAVSSLGKTAFAVQLAAEWARSRDVLFFTVEMPTDEIVARLLSRLSKISGGRSFTTRTIRSRERREELQAQEDNDLKSVDITQDLRKVQRTLAEEYKNLYIFQGDDYGFLGVQNIADRVTNHINLTGQKPIVFVDYLQILSPTDMKATDKQNADRAILALKALSRTHDILVFVISSFNRSSYNTQVDLTAFKESGAIEYSADVLLGLQPEGMGKTGMTAEQMRAHKHSEKRNAQLVIIKNRNGRTGDVLRYLYTPKYHLFEEQDKAKDSPVDSYVDKENEKS